MRRAGVRPEEIEEFWEEAISAEDDLLRICGRWVTLVRVIEGGHVPSGSIAGLDQGQADSPAMTLVMVGLA
jgi:hypothetical protein